MRHHNIATALATLCLTLTLATSCGKSDEQQMDDVLQNVRQLNELQLATATVSKVYTIRDPYYDDREPGADADKSFTASLQRFVHTLEHTVKVGDRIGVYSISNDYAAVINLDALTPGDISLDTSTKGVKRLSIQLPAVTVKSLGTDFITRVYHERTGGLRSPITEAERSQMREHARAQFEQYLRQDNATVPALKSQAEAKATAFFTTMLQNMGYQPTITFKQQSTPTQP